MSIAFFSFFTARFFGYREMFGGSVGVKCRLPQSQREFLTSGSGVVRGRQTAAPAALCRSQNLQRGRLPTT